MATLSFLAFAVLSGSALAQKADRPAVKALDTNGRIRCPGLDPHVRQLDPALALVRVEGPDRPVAGGEAGDELVNNPEVKAVSFTGSNEVGLGVYQAAAKRGVRALCEMGGKNAVIVLDDANFDLTYGRSPLGC